ncbi:MAG TPA: Gfo/Idh/MocA family oxidoreductase, partial [Salinimicrobium sp.]|nr:Gfo/Idh/MocA family oxidoreductase [Salinimicrobium sp.]
MKIINVALVGFGSGARIYNAPIISSVTGLEIRKILTSHPDNIEAAKNDFPGAEVVQDYNEILNDPVIELVVVAVPNHFHKELAEKALKANKHVVVEKPITPTVEEANELIALAKKHHKILSVHHNRRWASDFLTIKNLLDEGKLGEIVEYEAHFDRFRNEIKKGWKEEKENPGSGILYDLGSHLIDQALVLFGLPDEVFANLRIQRKEAKVTDNFELLLFYPDLKVTLKAGMLVKEKGPTYSIFGTKGSFVKYGEDVQEAALKRGEKPKNYSNWGKEPEEIWGKLNTIEEQSLVESEKGNYNGLYENVYHAILGKEALEVKPQQAKNVIRIIELAKQSH